MGHRRSEADPRGMMDRVGNIYQKIYDLSIDDQRESGPKGTAERGGARGKTAPGEEDTEGGTRR